MKKANFTNKALVGLTLLFMLVAALSFSAFRETKEACSASTKCTETNAPRKGGEMIWDGFSRRFTSMITVK